jgi:uncharacterized protein (TIGR03084 family)
VDALISDLAAQHAELGAILAGLSSPGWHAPTRCPGWDVADVVLHLAQTDRLAVGSATGTYPVVVAELSEGVPVPASIDEAAASMVDAQRGLAHDHLYQQWSSGATRLVDTLAAMDLSTRVTWVAGQLSARTLVSTRLAETWIHTGDVAGALGLTLAPSDRLRPIARLAWRTLPYAFASAGLEMAGPVEFRLISPGGDPWDFVPDERAVTTVRGPAVELCDVAARRVDPAATSLHGRGPDLDSVLALVRTYAR